MSVYINADPFRGDSRLKFDWLNTVVICPSLLGQCGKGLTKQRQGDLIAVCK